MSKHSMFGVDTFNTFWVMSYIKVFAWRWRQQWQRWQSSIHNISTFSLKLTSKKWKKNLKIFWGPENWNSSKNPKIFHPWVKEILWLCPCFQYVIELWFKDGYIMTELGTNWAFSQSASNLEPKPTDDLDIQNLVQGSQWREKIFKHCISWFSY